MALGGLLITSLVGCSSSGSSSSSMPIPKNGFLGDYSGLKDSGYSGGSRFASIDTEADFTTYKAVMVDPVEFWVGTDHEEIPEAVVADLQMMAAMLSDSIAKSLKGEYELATKPGPGVIRLRVALIEAGADETVKVADSTESGGAQPTTAISEFGREYINKAGVQAELLDSESGERLVAVVDERAGGSKPFLGSWNSARDAFSYWGGAMLDRLALLKEASKVDALDQVAL